MTNVRPDAAVDIDTRFGPCSAPLDSVVTMAEGLPGFEQCRRFVLASSVDIAPFTCVHGLDAPHPSFLAIDPHLVVDGYAPALEATHRQRLDAADNDTLLWLSLVHVDADCATVNMRAPLVINPRRMLGLQIIPAASDYALDHPLPLD